MPHILSIVTFLPLLGAAAILVARLLNKGGQDAAAPAARWIALGSCAPNPAVQDNRCHFFLGLECEQVAALDLDPSEELRVWAAPWTEAEAMLREGRIEHALVQVALLRMFLWEGWPELRARLERPLA